jgi:hypothetical protein
MPTYLYIIQCYPAVNHKGRMLSVGELIMNVHSKGSVPKSGTTKGLFLLFFILQAPRRMLYIRLFINILSPYAVDTVLRLSRYACSKEKDFDLNVDISG